MPNSNRIRSGSRQPVHSTRSQGPRSSKAKVMPAYLRPQIASRVTSPPPVPSCSLLSNGLAKSKSKSKACHACFRARSSCFSCFSAVPWYCCWFVDTVPRFCASSIARARVSLWVERGVSGLVLVFGLLLLLRLSGAFFAHYGCSGDLTTHPLEHLPFPSLPL